MLIVAILGFATIEQYNEQPFESYQGLWYHNLRHADYESQKFKIFLDLQSASENVTRNVTVFRLCMDFPMPPTRKLPSEPFTNIAVYLPFFDRIFSVFSPEPLVQVETTLMRRLNVFGNHISDGLMNGTEFNHSDIHSELLTWLKLENNSDILTFWLHRNCSSEFPICRLTGSIFKGNSTLSILAAEYDFMERQREWRMMLTLCAIATVLMIYACARDAPVWGDLSPHSLVLSSGGMYVMLMIFYMKRDHFDLNGSYGFAFVGFIAFFIPFVFLDFRYGHIIDAYDNDTLRQIPSFVKWWAVLFLYWDFSAAPGVVMFICFSFWVPQIVYSAVSNNRKSVSYFFLVLYSLGYLLFCGSIMKYHPLFAHGFSPIMKIPTIWLIIQMIIVALQNAFGGAFFMPNSCQKKRFDYKAEKPPPDSECAVCLTEVTETDDYLSTPCHHYFHDECLRRWIQEQQICPVCRTRLPSLEIPTA